MRRLVTRGRKNESEKDRWLLTRIAGPSAGIASMLSVQGRKRTRSQGPTTIHLSTQ